MIKIRGGDVKLEREQPHYKEIRITTRECDGEVVITGIDALRANQLPIEYLAGESVWLAELPIPTLRYAYGDVLLSVGSTYSACRFEFIMSIIRRCGERLRQINEKKKTRYVKKEYVI